jgi:hypothetical protein
MLFRQERAKAALLAVLYILAFFALLSWLVGVFVRGERKLFKKSFLSPHPYLSKTFKKGKNCCFT